MTQEACIALLLFASVAVSAWTYVEGVALDALIEEVDREDADVSAETSGVRSCVSVSDEKGRAA